MTGALTHGVTIDPVRPTPRGGTGGRARAAADSTLSGATLALTAALGHAARKAAGRGGRALRDAALRGGREGGTLLAILGRGAVGALRRDPGAAARRAVPLALALAVLATATGQSERHPAPWFAGDAPTAAANGAPVETAAPRFASSDAAPSAAARADGEQAEGERGDGERADPVVFGLQAELTDRGFYRGAIDGIAGSRTRAAIRAWQRSEGLPETGRADEGTLARVRAGASDLPRPAVASAPASALPVPRPAPSREPTDPVATGSVPNAEPVAARPAGAAPAAATEAANAGEDGADAVDGEADAVPLALQRGLVAWGADIAVDGVIGPRTRRALDEYRGANGLGEMADAALAAHMRRTGLLP